MASDRGKALAGRCTLNRLELTGAEVDEQERYKKIAMDPDRIDGWMVDAFVESHESAPEEIVLDLDATDTRSMASRKAGSFTVTSVQLCCSTTSPIGLSVAVQFINTNDVELAKQIKGWFFSLRGYWKLKEIEHIKWRQNPSGSARVVIFWDHGHAAGLTAAFNDCCLLEEGVDHRAKEPDMPEDITIVVFNKERN